jgi:hypothetical protein
MPRRQHEEETGFGSDSFLDIVANMVGILIILIVIAGMRVSMVPPAPASGDGEEPIDIPPPVVGTTEAPIWPAPLALPPTDIPAPPEPIVIDLTPEPDPSLEIAYARQLAAVKQLESQLPPAATDADASLAAAAAAERDWNAAIALVPALDERVRQGEAEYGKLAAALAAQRAALDSGETQIAGLQLQVDAAREQLAALPEQTDAATEIRHDLTPVSELIRGKEIHFHLKRGRVAEVPIEALMEQVKEQAERKRDWLLKSGGMQAVAGPVQGFRLKFTLERQSLSAIEELRMGAGMVRIGLSEWTIEPDESIPAETVAQASQPNSRFMLTLRAASLGTACTFWVYPDSFEEFRELQKLVHKHELRVAGRPLPEGIPISGSPHGSRSAAQ